MKFQLIGLAAYAMLGVYAQNDSSVVESLTNSSSSSITDSSSDLSSTDEASVPDSITNCHYHGTEQYCDANGTHGEVVGAPTDSEEGQSSYTGCHTHSSETYCLDDNGEEVQFVADAAEADESGSESGSESTSESASESASESGSESTSEVESTSESASEGTESTQAETSSAANDGGIKGVGSALTAALVGILFL
ncbi:uncharacterized protein CYBJADRAFT_168160 [Cyberlindnera jadinii NRRL Y-1542]|uniref:Uncharacterized protein n=1 Tax=Cyberlindnera jadinii (strain ATCC 18201 / CBS 1600 / BCRC 20928 / JCM 3617 / NBRC 0987 / NRRL Y-1542) TaxID=983966 RepID=A0A1E4S0T1_CYBJN|nr:hypothetical protein CYBJADRAFT_168160 [Cyberlindnera jadinii NRRL Y-1542]ODV73099.1 hypothetical protein CYBJADRAFT_168160 [Cyberlindnera jadinii NRRL Y-1542]